jgi:hypothetical protein
MKTDNGRGAIAAKIEMRRNALASVREAAPVRVFDAFCGTGKMREAVWFDADYYAGCDARDWSIKDAPRFVADNRLVLRSLDLGAFNVFDFDAYGSPWQQMAILLARRQWAPGERGAVILTDGSSMKLRFGGMPHAMIWILGAKDMSIAPSMVSSDAAQEMTLRAWINRAKVTPVRRWQASGRGSGRGGQVMSYTAIVFDGNSSR